MHPGQNALFTLLPFSKTKPTIQSGHDWHSHSWSHNAGHIYFVYIILIVSEKPLVSIRQK
jgi:hypothetical protein